MLEIAAQTRFGKVWYSSIIDPHVTLQSLNWMKKLINSKGAIDNHEDETQIPVEGSNADPFSHILHLVVYGHG
jgi:hypothetical protein